MTDTIAETMTPDSKEAGGIPEHALVWCEIPVRDLADAVDYYGKVLGRPLTVEDGGPNQMARLPTRDGGTAGHLYPGTPAAGGAGPTVHLHVNGLEAALERVMAAGGRVLPGIFPLPMGRFAYTVDPDGNSIGLFEPTPEG